jgi:hypothetical protein
LNRNIFFFEGLITMALGFAAPLILPQSPATANWLTDTERHIAVQRLVLQSASTPNEKVTTTHIRRAIFNINNTICAAGFLLINITVQGLSLFMPTILREMGYQGISAQFYSVPVYVSASIVAIVVAFASDKTRQRGIYLATFTVFPIIGFSLLRWNRSVAVRYASLYLCALGAFPGGPGFLSWGVNNSAGPAVRAVASAWIVSLGTLGGIIATWSYLSTDGPIYPIGQTINLVSQIGVMLLASGGIVYCAWENRVRKRGGRDDRLVGKSEDEVRDLGFKHPSFRYIT